MKVTTQIWVFAAIVLLAGLACYGPSGLHQGVPLLPPIVAIGLALITREVVVSLFLGIFTGAVAVILALPDGGYSSLLARPNALIEGLLRTVDTYILNGVSDKDHATIVLFSLAIGGMIAVVARSGGLQGIVALMAGKADSAGWTQMAAYLMGVVIFFDDYANTLIVGNTLRPLNDRARVSREKLSFIVDATAAPIASVAILSAWIGYEVGLIGDAFAKAGIETDAYLAFLESLPYRFYAFLLLVFIPLSIFLKRDFGSMLRAERRARRTGAVLRPGSQPLAGEELDKLEAPEGKPLRWYNAAVPILTLIAVTLVGLFYTGIEGLAESGVLDSGAYGIRDVLGSADSAKVLLWSSLISSIVAIGMVVYQDILSFHASMEAWISGVKAMVLAMVILSLAWGIGAVVGELGTARAVSDLVTQSGLPGEWLPALIFVTAAAISFATGTSWGTMAILFPVSIPLVLEFSGNDPAAIDSSYLGATVGAILTGAIFGDHCSPISDTTVLSSMASAVDHMDHVTTQMPYCLSIGAIALVTGYIPSGYGMNPYLANLIGVACCLAILLIFGQDPNEPAPGPEPPPEAPHRRDLPV